MRIRATQEMSVCADAFVEELPQASVSSGSGYVKGRTITHGSLKRGLWKVSWPIFVTALCLSTVDLVHVQCAGTLEGNAQAMIGVCDQLMMICLIVITSFANAGAALVSKAFGAGNSKAVASMNNKMLGLLVASAVVMLLAILVLSKVLLTKFSGCVDNCDYTIGEGQKYLNIVVYGLVPYAFVASINSTFIGIGNARVQLITLSLMTIVDMAMNYLLVIKGWPVKGMGISGIATASIAAYSVATVAAIFMWWRSDIFAKGKQDRDSKSTGSEFFRPLLRGGVPAAMQDVAWCSSTFVLFYILSLLKHPAEAVAAWTIGQRLEAFALLPLSAMSMAVMVAVGQNVGSGRLERAWKAAWGVTALGVGLLFAAAIALFCLADTLARGATTDEATRTALVSYLQIAAFALPFAALEAVLSGALQAINDCRVPMLISLFFNWVVGLSLAYIFAVSLGHGSSGAWLAAAISTTIIGIAITLRFLTNSEWRGFSPLAGRLAKHAKPSPSQMEVAGLSQISDISSTADAADTEAAFNEEHVSRGKKAREIDLPKDV